MVEPSKKRRPAPSSHKPTPTPTDTITDPRFAHIQHDPRYRLPGRKDTHVKLDKRFSRMLKGDEFTSRARVDRYGRRLSSNAGRRRLERKYEVDEDDEGAEGEGQGDEDEEVRKELRRVEGASYDPARQGGYSESSSSEEESDETDVDDQDPETEEAGGVGRIEEDSVPTGEVTNRIAVVNLDWDNIRAVDLMAVASSFCPAGGRVLNVTVYPSEFGRERMEREEMEGPPKELFSSAKARSTAAAQAPPDAPLPPDNLEDEDEDLDDETIKQNLLRNNDSTEIDTPSLRRYQLTRLRYFYAVLTTDTRASAQAIYAQMDGQEYLSTANFFDLRFVPDDTTFSDPVTDRPRDSCDAVPAGYRPNEFVTEALTHSKVSLTWDADDGERMEAQKRAFSRKEVEENDLVAYLGSGSSGDDDDEEQKGYAEAGADASTSTRKEAARTKMRALLGLASASTSSTSSKTPPVGPMQITFSAGLSSNSASNPTPTSIYANKPSDVRSDAETTRDAYVRKERERKARRRERAKMSRDGVHRPAPSDPTLTQSKDAHVDDLLQNEEEEEGARPQTHHDDAEAEEEADPFADPFFTAPATSTSTSTSNARKEAKRAARNAKAAEDARNADARARELEQLRAVMGSSASGASATGPSEGQSQSQSQSQGFDMAAIKKREKDERRSKSGKSKSKSKKLDENEKRRRVRDDDDDDDDDNNNRTAHAANDNDIDIDTTDPRFSQVYSRHEYAIDPTNPRFSGTREMRKMLEAGRSKRRRDLDEDEDENENGIKIVHAARGAEKRRREGGRWRGGVR